MTPENNNSTIFIIACTLLVVILSPLLVAMLAAPEKTEQEKKDSALSIRRFEIDGHHYLEKEHYNCFSVWLDPDCPKCLKRKEINDEY